MKVKKYFTYIIDNNIATAPILSFFSKDNKSNFIQEARLFVEKAMNYVKTEFKTTNKQRYKKIVLVSQFEKFYIHQRKDKEESSTTSIFQNNEEIDPDL